LSATWLAAGHIPWTELLSVVLMLVVVVLAVEGDGWKEPAGLMGFGVAAKEEEEIFEAEAGVVQRREPRDVTLVHVRGCGVRYDEAAAA
jgi:hypothetical protein